MKNFLFGCVVAVCVFAISMFSPISTAFAGQEDPNELEVVVLTNGILHQVKALLKAQGKDHEKQVSALKENILKRKSKLLQMMEKNPGKVMNYLFPADVVAQFPDEVKGLLETPLQAAGELTTIVAEFSENVSQNFYYLKDKNNHEFRLHFGKDEPELLSGSLIKIDGTKIDDNNVFVAAGRSSGSGSTSSTQTVQVAAAATTGEQRTIVIPVNFQDSALSCSSEDLNSMFFTATSSIKELYREASFDQVNITGMVAPRVTIPDNSTDSCAWGSTTGYTLWANNADQILRNQGIEPNDYARKVYQFPNSPSCGGIAWGTIGGSPSKSWVFRCEMSDASAHEYGHNLGLHHANTGSLTADTGEYYDWSSIMGHSNIGLRHPNSANKASLGWIPTARIQTISSSGTYMIYRSEDGNTTTTQILKIQKPDTNDYFYISFRFPMGFDNSLSSSYANKVNIHRFNGTAGTKTYFLSALDNGQSFNDPVNAITMTHLSHDANIAVVSIDMPGAIAIPCTLSNPTLALSPVNKSGSKGQTLSYSLNVKNNNSNCASSTFNLNQTLPANFAGSFSASNVTLADGANTNVSWNVTSDVSALDATYLLTATVANQDDSSKAANIDASFVVFTDTGAPIVTITSPSSGTSMTNQLAVKATATDDIKVIKVEFYVDDILISTDTSAPYSSTIKGRQFNVGTHTLTVKAYDGSNNMGSASISVKK